MNNDHHMRMLCCALALLWLGAPRSAASSFGADAGLSGGPKGWGQSCTQCHGFDSGTGFTQILNVPAAYEPGGVYDLLIRVADADKEGAGFQFSAEAGGAVVGTIIVTDATNTQLVNDNDLNFYLTHTFEGVEESIAMWDQQGGMADYGFQWQAPAEDIGPIRFYAAGNAINDGNGPFGDTIYLAVVTVEPTVAADGDDDGDTDYGDFALLQECYDLDPLPGECNPFDLDGSSLIDIDDYDAYLEALTGPTALGPSAYRHADPARGARLYDRWWRVNGAPTPVGEHPLYPPEGGQTGSTTYRCKECHGWDYKGVDGAYGSGSHFTGIPGVLGTQLSVHQIFDLIKNDTLPNGHNMAAYGLEDDDIWDLAKFLTEYLVDTDSYIDGNDEFLGDASNGQTNYDNTCASCHGDDGRAINFGSPEDPEYLGTLSNGNPWEFLHKVRGGQPGSPMPSFIDLDWTPQRAADVGLHAQSLPVE